MAGKRKRLQRLTPDELARRAANRQRAHERAEFHRAMAEKLKEREQEQRRLAG